MDTKSIWFSLPIKKCSGVIFYKNMMVVPGWLSWTETDRIETWELLRSRDEFWVALDEEGCGVRHPMKVLILLMKGFGY